MFTSFECECLPRLQSHPCFCAQCCVFSVILSRHSCILNTWCTFHTCVCLAQTFRTLSTCTVSRSGRRSLCASSTTMCRWSAIGASARQQPWCILRIVCRVHNLDFSPISHSFRVSLPHCFLICSFLRIKVLDWQSQYQSEVIPIPRFPPQDGCVTVFELQYEFVRCCCHPNALIFSLQFRCNASIRCFLCFHFFPQLSPHLLLTTLLRTALSTLWAASRRSCSRRPMRVAARTLSR